MSALPPASDERPPPADRVPTLTEVVELGRAPAPPAAAAPRATSVAPSPRETAALVAQVLLELGPRIDALLEARLREVLGTALARVADGLVKEVREHLRPTVRDLVEDAVRRGLQRNDGRADRS